VTESLKTGTVISNRGQELFGSLKRPDRSRAHPNYVIGTRGTLACSKAGLLTSV